MNVAATLTYGDPTAAQGATDGIHLIDSWQKVLAPAGARREAAEPAGRQQRQRRLLQVRRRQRVAPVAAHAGVPVLQAPVSMTTLVVHPADRPLTGSVPVPSDESIGHRALLLGALGQGDTRLEGYLARRRERRRPSPASAPWASASPSLPRARSWSRASASTAFASRPGRSTAARSGGHPGPALRRARGRALRRHARRRRAAVATPDDPRRRASARARGRHRRLARIRGATARRSRRSSSLRGRAARQRGGWRVCSTRAPAPARGSRARSCSRACTPTGPRSSTSRRSRADHTERMLGALGVPDPHRGPARPARPRRLGPPAAGVRAGAPRGRLGRRAAHRGRAARRRARA